MQNSEGTYSYTWSAFEKDIKVIQKLIDFTEYDYLCGVAKGGLPLLVKLVNITKLPYIIVECNSYEGRVRKEIYLKKFDNLDRQIATNKRFLLVDDITDSGTTIKTVVEHLKWLGAASVETLTLFYKPQSIVVPEWYLHEVENHQWIKFPWEG
jgi:hypoxanthine phosphoribosyltransferase